MRIDRATVGLALLALLAAAAPIRAQDAPSGVGPRTEVRSIEFRFEGDHILTEADLKPRIALTGQGSFVWLRKLLAVLPLLPPVGPHPFDPVELQRDVVRLREYYRDAGFLHADVRYDVRYDRKSDLVKIAFVVREGPPLRIRSLTFTGAREAVARDSAARDSAASASATRGSATSTSAIRDSGMTGSGVKASGVTGSGAQDSALALPPELKKPWARYTSKRQREAGRFGEAEQRALADSAGRWFRDRGYPFASAEVTVAVDTAASLADVTVSVSPGARARIAGFEVEGNDAVPDEHLIRQLPIGRGDWYSAKGLEQGRLQLTQLDIVRLAIFDTPRQPIHDSGVVVRLQVTENPSRLVNGDAGFASDGGLTGQVEWTNRSFLGGVRTFTVAGLAQTGVLAFEQPSQRLYRIGGRLFQPYVGSRRVSAGGGPFVEYRDDFRDRSWAFGFEGSLVYATSPLRSVSLGYSLSRRRIFDYGFGADLGPIEYLPLLGLSRPGAVDTLSRVTRRSTLTLQGSYGWFDEFTYPRRGYVLRPRIEVTVPGGFNTSEYVLLDLGGSAFLPLTRRIGVAFRGGVGRIYPYGRSVSPTENESPVVSLLRLGDVTFTAGGTRDVRGWGTQLVGPKLPEVETETVDGEPRTFAERYTPLGGLARLTGSVELRLPLPGFSDAWQSVLFVDGGRIWIPDRRFALNAGVLDQDDFYTGVGAGISYVTVVGAVQFAVGYKLNPSALDVRSAGAVLDALAGREPVTTVPTESRQRLHLHFAIGTTF